MSLLLVLSDFLNICKFLFKNLGTKYMKGCLASLVISKINPNHKISHFALVWLNFFKRWITANVDEDVGKFEPHTLPVGM